MFLFEPGGCAWRDWVGEGVFDSWPACLDCVGAWLGATPSLAVVEQAASENAAVIVTAATLMVGVVQDIVWLRLLERQTLLSSMVSLATIMGPPVSHDLGTTSVVG